MVPQTLKFCFNGSLNHNAFDSMAPQLRVLVSGRFANIRSWSMNAPEISFYDIAYNQLYRKGNSIFRNKT